MADTSCSVCGSPVSLTDTICHTCGAPLTEKAASSAVALSSGSTLLGGQYVIGKVLGQGGFGITYDGQDQRLGLRVAIKELFVDGSSRRGTEVISPSRLSTTEFKETKVRFLDEAKMLARFNDPNIVRVFNYFEENNTAYLVMEFLEGMTLGSAIEKQGKLSAQSVQEIAKATAHTLEVVHAAGLLHRDIKPDNIFLHKSGRVVLIDFGSVRTFASGQTVSHTRMVTPGYAPLEQYSSAAKFGPYTDIYSLGATLHHALTGEMPPPATDLMMGTPLPPLPPETPAYLRRAIEKSMATQVQDRPQTAKELIDLLEPPAEALPQVVRQPAPAAQKPVAQQPAPAPARPKPTPAQPKPQPTPAPRPNPQPAPQPAARPAQQSQQSQPAQPVPSYPINTSANSQPNSQPAPSNTSSRQKSNVPRNIFVVICALLGGYIGAFGLTDFIPELASYGQSVPMIGGAVGLLGGLLLGMFIWYAMPFALPLVAAVITYLYAQANAYHWPTAISMSVIAAVLSLFFMMLIRRI